MSYNELKKKSEFIKETEREFITRIIEFRGCVVRTGGGLIPLADSINIFLYFCTVMFASRHVEII